MRLLIFWLLIILPLHSFASIHLEPYTGLGNSNFSVDVNNSDDSDSNGYKAVGAKLGWGILGFDFGVDFELDTDDDLSRRNLSAYAAFEFPILFRIWAEHVLSSNLDMDKVDVDLGLVSGTSIGVGFTGLPFVHLNLEMENTKYDGSKSGLDYDVQWVSYLFSVSMPFDF